MKYDIVVVGAGPAGLAAAHSAAGHGASVAIIDDNAATGGQIWRGGAERSGDARAAALAAALRDHPHVSLHLQTRVIAPLEDGALLIENGGLAKTLRYDKLVLATGARELLLPFPGWTLPGVTGAGGLQALAKGGFPVAGKRIVVAGSGPLLLASAASLIERGAKVSHILEQASLARLARFAGGLLATPSKLMQALRLFGTLRGAGYRSGAYVVRAEGEQQLTSVIVRNGNREQRRECDYLACGYGLLPNTELAGALGCILRDGAIQVDQWQQTSRPGIWCAGEGSGIGGVDLALVEGAIAGHAAAGVLDAAQALFAQRARWQGFARQLARQFALRPELRQLCEPDTLVCRCEDVAYAQLQPHADWRSAKLHTRCGMGACQGRICGAACGHLFGWRKDASRLPIMPARIGSLGSDAVI